MSVFVMDFEFQIYSLIHFLVQIVIYFTFYQQNMNKVVSPIIKANLKNLISLSELKAIRQNDESVLTVEIGKEPTTLFKNSLWIGYRNGGMASWLSTLLPHLPHSKFCLYMDEDSYKGSQYMYSYYSEYFAKLFHKEYLGICIHPRKFISSKEMGGLNEVKASELQQHLSNSKNSNQKTVLLDLRGSEVASKCSINNLIRDHENASYINLPLNDEDLLEILHSKTSHLPSNTKFITMCAKGYRSMIGYSFLQLLKKPTWDIVLCRNPSNQIKEVLHKQKKAQSQSYASYSALAFN